MGVLTDYFSISIIFVGYGFFTIGLLLFIYCIDSSDFNSTYPSNSNNDGMVSLEVLHVNDEENENSVDAQESESDDNVDRQSSKITINLLVGNPQFLYFLFIILLAAIVKAVAGAYLYLFLSGLTCIDLCFLFYDKRLQNNLIFFILICLTIRNRAFSCQRNLIRNVFNYERCLRSYSFLFFQKYFGTHWSKKYDNSGSTRFAYQSQFIWVSWKNIETMDGVAN